MVRQRDEEEKELLDPVHARLAEEICKAVLMRWQDDPHLCILYSGVLACQRHDYPAAQVQISKAEWVVKVPVTIRFEIFFAGKVSRGAAAVSIKSIVPYRIIRNALFPVCPCAPAQTNLRMRQSVASTENDTMDLASYVDFQNSFKVVLEYHRMALRAVKFFWKSLLAKEVASGTLDANLRRIESLIEQ